MERGRVSARLVRADPGHIPHLAAHMREEDRNEVWAWSLSHPEQALTRSFAASAMAWTCMVDDEPVCMFGVGAPTMLSGEARPWLLGTDRLHDIPHAFARLSVEGVRRMMVYPVLANWSDARHERAHEWLDWLGFQVGEPRPMGPLGMPFRPFVMECFRYV